MPQSTTDIAAVLGALGIFTTSLASAYVLVRGQRHIAARVEDTHRQVVTLNESTIGELAAADETRRAQQIAHDARTVKEQRHIDTAPEVGAAQGPVRMADRLAHVEHETHETHEKVDRVHHAVNGDLPDPHPSLYELVQQLAAKLDDQTATTGRRLERLERTIGEPSD